ncbi:DUF5949 family protein [Streptomyces sp. MUM 178J]|uniref:DUF5949 family protein n=1 Tax=Streptomyces sp. MUM 178J TaxID=2791991 RepID=UPI001F043DF1|nr:DUF5949 family protein [Streptomyces sp. MUM 178J]WRQ81623.1 DUF5949 family protein [Streptomyces sp. MUM 178J]
MTTAQSGMQTGNSTFQRGHLGTMSLLAWTGDPEQGHDMPYLIVYSLGDGPEGPEATHQALLAVIADAGLAVDGQLADVTRSTGSPVKLLVEAGQAVLSMPHLNAQCPAPPEWLTAVEQRGHAHFLFATRPWPEAVPGEPVTEEMLQSYLGDESTLTTAAHALLPVSRLRG